MPKKKNNKAELFDVDEVLYEMLLVDILDSLVKSGDIDPQRANIIKASYTMDKYLKAEAKNDPS